ncbi:MAG: RecX family transcriptional regulator [Psychrobium sp.]
MHPPLKQAKTIDQVFNSAYWHLNQQDFTIEEIRKKLNRKTTNQAWIDEVMNHLIDNKYLKTDLEFAVRFCESAFSNGVGKGAIGQKLTKRGISTTDIETAIEKVVEQDNIDFQQMAIERLQSRYENFEGISKEKLYAQMNNRGFSHAQINRALEQHPAQETLRTKLAIKADKADLTQEIFKLYRKGKGRTLILNELKQRLIDVSEFEDTVYQLEMTDDIDFYHSCQQQLAKKRYDLSDFKEKSKAYAYLSRKGFTSDEIKEAMTPTAD